MRIAVIGPQNTGKTTFVRDFLQTFTRYTTPTETYRDEVKKLGLPLNQNVNEASQGAILNFLYKQIVEHEGSHIIFDRCVIDNYVYTYCAHTKGQVSKEFLMITKRKMYDHLRYLDCIFFIPTAAGVSLVADTQRDIDPAYVDLVNRIFMETLFEISHKTHLPVFVITGNREERIRCVQDKIT